MQINLHKFVANVNVQLRCVWVGAARGHTAPLTLQLGFDRVGHPLALEQARRNLPALLDHQEQRNNTVTQPAAKAAKRM
jgi:hypothetical protein